MGDFMAVVAQTVGAAVVQEALSRTVSFVLGKRKEKASQEQYQERFRKAVSDVEFVLERTAKMPITEVSLLRDRFELKRDFVQAACLLSSRHKKRQAPQRQQEMTQAVTCSSSTQRSVSSFISMSKDDLLCLSCDDLERFERFADIARNILARVESGCSLRRWMHFPCPLVRHLFEWKTTIFGRMVQADEERGVEAMVMYMYLNYKRPEKSFTLWFVLRLSESTDIVGIASDCLQSLASQFNLVADTAMGELTQLASNLQDVSHSHALPLVRIQERYKEITQMYRPEPLCCKEKGHGSCTNNIVSSELSHVFPEEVTFFCFDFFISAPEYSLRSSSKRSVQRKRRPPLEMSVIVMPHYVWRQASYAVEIIGDNDRELVDASIQQAGEIVKSRALSCFLRQPKVTKYGMEWFTKHGAATFHVKKLRAGELKTSAANPSPEEMEAAGRPTAQMTRQVENW